MYAGQEQQPTNTDGILMRLGTSEVRRPQSRVLYGMHSTSKQGGIGCGTEDFACIARMLRSAGRCMLRRGMTHEHLREHDNASAPGVHVRVQLKSPRALPHTCTMTRRACIRVPKSVLFSRGSSPFRGARSRRTRYHGTAVPCTFGTAVSVPICLFLRLWWIPIAVPWNANTPQSLLISIVPLT